jgi:hypothetical protein
MSLRLIARQLGVLVLSLGVLLSGAAQAHAISCFGTMSSGSTPTVHLMTVAKGDMQGHCASMAMKQQPQQKSPIKCMDCAACTACGVSGDAMFVSTIVAKIGVASGWPLAPDASRYGVVERPALPPPIILV